MGCGAGSVVMGRAGGQLSAATTNNITSINQSFSITLGMSNCLTDEELAMVEAQEKFVADNFESLERQIARGEGDALKGFAATFACNGQQLPTFTKVLKGSYQEIFQAPGALAAYEKMVTTLKTNN